MKPKLKNHKKPSGKSFLRKHFPQVREVIDATKPVKVVVSAKDNTDGQKNQPTECAMAKAMRREFKADGVIIGLSVSYIIKGTQAIRYKTTDTVAREITSFDRHQDFAPGVYGLSPISPANRTDHPRGKPSGTNPARMVHKTTARVRTLK